MTCASTCAESWTSASLIFSAISSATEVEMPGNTRCGSALKWAAGALGLAAGAYATWAGTAWFRYGQPPPASPEDADPLLDQFMPSYEVAERHHISVAAPADVTFAAACEQDLMAPPFVWAIFKARELVLGCYSDTGACPRRLLAIIRSCWWGVR